MDRLANVSRNLEIHLLHPPPPASPLSDLFMEKPVSDRAFGGIGKMGPLGFPFIFRGRWLVCFPIPEPHVWVCPRIFLWLWQCWAPRKQSGAGWVGGGEVGERCVPLEARSYYQLSHDGGRANQVLSPKARHWPLLRQLRDRFNLCCCLLSKRQDAEWGEWDYQGWGEWESWG